MGRPNRSDVDRRGNRRRRATQRQALGRTSDSQYTVPGGPSVQKNASDDTDQSNEQSAKSFLDPYEINELTSHLKTAISNVDYDEVHAVLNNCFDKVAVGEYKWILEMKLLGLSVDEIADELLERSQHGPWIYSEFNVPDVKKRRRRFHLPSCLHGRKEDETMSTVSPQPNQALMSLESPLNSPETLEADSVRETIGYLCGIGGVSPMPDGSPSLQFGSVVFENANTTAIISLGNRDSQQTVSYIFQHLKKAIGTLQQVGGCCDSFTFLAIQETLVELGRIDTNDGASALEPLISLTNPEANLVGLGQDLLSSLTAQFYSLAFALYAQGHCEPFSPFFLDTSLKRILLIGNQIWSPYFTGPCIVASIVELSCFGEMIQRRVFAFQYFQTFERSKVFSDYGIQFDLKACPEDLLDTWGPGDFIIPKHDSENLHAISIGGGLITCATTQTENHRLPTLHWSPASKCNTTVNSTFPRHEKMVIGSRVFINQACKVTPQEQVPMAIPWLKELGTFPSYWEVSERQLGLGVQAGQSVVGILSFAQTWVKRLGQTKKSNILAKRSLSIADLEGLFAVQVSFCTGIARRVRLRELLADMLPAYVADLATKPCLWERLQSCDILGILRHEDFTAHYKKLDHELQVEFETLAIAVLFLLQDTGVDRKGESFVIGYIPQGSGVLCFKVPIERESFWARILADSQDVATFAYVATKCFETDLVKCRGPNEQWMNTTALFSTAVSPCPDRKVTQEIVKQQRYWTLKDSEAYLIGQVDAPLLVRVIRPFFQDEPELVVSMSTIIAPILRRLSRKQGHKRPWRLRESRAIDHQHKMAESVVVTAAFQGSK
ncbi:ankyrin 3 [Fusarium sp. NRRL 52700]|nr:ankyrin 3 [Fusarium sp. NRRL 52700]